MGFFKGTDLRRFLLFFLFVQSDSDVWMPVCLSLPLGDHKTVSVQQNIRDTNKYTCD